MKSGKSISYSCSNSKMGGKKGYADGGYIPKKRMTSGKPATKSTVDVGRAARKPENGMM